MFPEPVLPTETGMLTEPGALTEISEPPEPELVLESLVLPAEVEVLLLPEPVLSTEIGKLTDGSVTDRIPPVPPPPVPPVPLPPLVLLVVAGPVLVPVLVLAPPGQGRAQVTWGWVW